MNTAENHKAREALVQDNRCKYLAQYFAKHGYSPDYSPGFNVLYNGPTVLRHIPEISPDDLIWFSNQIGNVHGSGGYECVDNLRLCKGSYFGGDPNWHYNEAKRDGCCGFYDRKFINPTTKNVFWYGFNYGH